MKKRLLFVALIPMMISVIGCQGNKDYFTYWEKRSVLFKLIDYVNDVTNKNSVNYIPVEDRIATFDMDGTFVGELYPTYFEYNLLEYRALEDPTYKDIAPQPVVEAAYQIRNHVREGASLPSDFDLIHGRAAAVAYSGMTIKEFDDYVKAYAQKTPYGFEGMTYATSFYKPMLQIFDFLEAHDFTYYVVSGSDRYLCRALVDSIGIPSNRVIGMDVSMKTTKQGDQQGVKYNMEVGEDVIRGDELLIKNLKTNKVFNISQEIGKVPVLSFGNSSGDQAMHNYCKGNTKYKTETFMLIADDEQEDHVNLEETARRKAIWEENNYNIISMKDDFKTIYGYNVQKVPFPWENN